MIFDGGKDNNNDNSDDDDSDDDKFIGWINSDDTIIKGGDKGGDNIKI